MKGLHVTDLAFRTFGPYSLGVAKGECVGLTGPSGVGKSLMLRSLADLDPHSGQIHLDEQEHLHVQPCEWRRQVALLPTESQWWLPNVGDHFMEPGGGNSLNTDLGELGLDPSCLAWEVERLSNGEKQRLALLRLLQHQPRALLLDEPTANLDRANVTSAETLIARFRRQTRAPVLWVSHDEDQLARVADRMLVMTGTGIEEVHT